ncbi:DUF952 domain-containing protein [Litoreibacter albidus]|uniref:Uncharacterized conserved protein, DUF952 family n=1 Tax=Litoreibacter albidus TaxID=670155 RepID=A0A1H2YXE4_9RHOB|nr:DUF952 domain-containing protein [Litoreibacter albidus]SDX09806.1 Uncharacterized conserved protein, DUF952 family [Litoreibacter albidus]
MHIYKIMTADAWSEFQASGRFTGAPIDLTDGYIHFSTAAQARETAAKHFAGQEDLWLVWGAAPQDAALKWEVSRGGAEFPHLYRDWLLAEVTGNAALPWDGAAHVFPDDMA